MSLEEKIENEYKSAMKARDTVRVSVIRMMKAEINNVKLKQNKSALTDDELIKVVRRQVKQHKDSIEQFEKGKRQDLVDKERKELAILQCYMPEEMPEEELKGLIAEAIKELGATTKKEMGTVIKAVMQKAAGKADGKTVSSIVAGILSKDTN